MSHNDTYNGISLYWLAAECPAVSYHVWFVHNTGNVGGGSNGNTNAGVRPVVKLPGTVEGTVGETIEINK